MNKEVPAHQFHKVYNMDIPDVYNDTRRGKMYHITQIENVDPIMKEGLNENKDLIWMLDKKDKATMCTIAMSKNFDYSDFALIEIDLRGVTGYVVNEHFGKKVTYVFVKQKNINPKHLKLLGYYRIDVTKIE